MILEMKNLNLLQKYGVLWTIKQQKVSRTIKSYDAFILITGDITVTGNNNTDVTFKNCATFSNFKPEIYAFIDEANNIYIVMPMYDLIEQSDNNSDTSGSLWQFKRDNVPAYSADLRIDNSKSFKYKAALLGKTANAVNNTNSSVTNTKIVVPLKYLSNFWISLEMLLINYKIHLELNWFEGCILSSDGHSAKFKIMDTKLHVPIVTLSTKDMVNLIKQLSDGFKRSVYWNSYQAIPAKVLHYGTNMYGLHSASFRVVKRSFVLAYIIATDAANNEAGKKNKKRVFSSKRRD